MVKFSDKFFKSRVEKNFGRRQTCCIPVNKIFSSEGPDKLIKNLNIK